MAGYVDKLGTVAGGFRRIRPAPIPCTPAAHQLTPGTGVLLYTDGVTEARHNGEQFGQRGSPQIVQALGGQSPSEVVAAVTTEVQQFAATGLADDLCVVAARTAEG